MELDLKLEIEEMNEEVLSQFDEKEVEQQKNYCTTFNPVL